MKNNREREVFIVENTAFTVEGLAEEIGCSYITAWNRLKKVNESTTLERLMRPVGERWKDEQVVVVEGKDLTVEIVKEQVNCSTQTAKWRLKNYTTLKDVLQPLNITGRAVVSQNVNVVVDEDVKEVNSSMLKLALRSI